MAGDVNYWSSEELMEFLSRNHVTTETIKIFLESKIDGNSFLLLEKKQSVR